MFTSSVYWRATFVNIGVFGRSKVRKVFNNVVLIVCQCQEQIESVTRINVKYVLASNPRN